MYGVLRTVLGVAPSCPLPNTNLMLYTRLCYHLHNKENRSKHGKWNNQSVNHHLACPSGMMPNPTPSELLLDMGGAIVVGVAWPTFPA